MNQLDLIKRSRVYVRDLTNSFFREQDVTAYINEAIERVGQVIPELENMELLYSHQQEVTHMPRHYQHLLALYASARLCSQDERHYQAGVFMNEFETKLSSLADDILSGDIEIIDPETGEVIDGSIPYGYVQNNYFQTKGGVVRPYRKLNQFPLDGDTDD